MEEKIEYTQLKYIPTGNIFKLPAEDAKEVIKTDRGNFAVVGGKDITEAEPQVEETTTYNMVVDTEDSGDTEDTTAPTTDNSPAQQDDSTDSQAPVEGKANLLEKLLDINKNKG